jgi:hypothetical protein
MYPLCSGEHSLQSILARTILWCYDTLIEEVGNGEDFERYYGKVTLYDSIALVSSSLLSGVIGGAFGLRAAYFLSIPFMVISIVGLLKFREPHLHKAGTKSSLIKHIAETLQAVLQKRSIFWIVIAMVLFTVSERIIFELFQLWFLAFALPVLFWGPATALQIAFMPLALLFGWLSTKFTVFKASWLVIVITLIAVLVFYGAVIRRKGRLRTGDAEMYPP